MPALLGCIADDLTGGTDLSGILVVAFTRDEAKITLTRVPDRPGIAYQILGPIADANVDVDMIVQNISVDGITDFSFTVRDRGANVGLDLRAVHSKTTSGGAFGIDHARCSGAGGRHGSHAVSTGAGPDDQHR